MGREIVYCEDCGHRLTEDDFTRGKAQDHDGRPFCSSCRPVTAPPPTTRPEGRGTERRSNSTSRRRGTERVPLAQPPRPAANDGGGSKVAIGVGAGLAVLVLIVVGVASSRREPPPPPPQEPVLAPIRVPAPPTLDPAEERRRELEAQERLKEKERATELERDLAALRRIQQEDPECRRRAEVEALFDAALRKSGPRTAEVQKLEVEYRALCEEAAKRKAAAEAKKAPPPAPVRKWSDHFTEATARIQANDYPGAKKIYLDAVPLLPEKRPEDIAQRALYCIGLYNIACIYAVEAGKLADKSRADAMDQAFRYLDWALRSDYGRFRCPCHPQTAGLGHMGDDKDMDPIRKEARYAELLKKYK